MNLQVSKIVGVSTESSWSQIHFFAPSEEEKIKKRGCLLAVVALEKNIAEGEIAVIGKEIIARLHEEYYGWLDSPAFFQLKKAVERVFEEVKDGLKIEILAASVADGVLNLAFAGKGEAILWRKGKEGVILKGSLDKIETASGFLEEEDRFLIGSEKFFEIVSEEKINQALICPSVKEGGEILSPFVLGFNQGSAAAIIAQYQEEEKEEERQEVEFKRKIKIKDWGLKIKSWLFQPPVKKNSTKSLTTVALIFALLLMVGVVYGGKERKRQEQEKRIGEILSQAKTKKEEGENLLSLNPSKARESFKEAERLLSEIREEELASSQLKNSKEELENQLVSLLKEYQINPELFFDLELIKKEAVGKDLVLSEESLLVLDTQNGSIYEIEINKKNNILASGEEIKEARSLTLGEGLVFLLTEGGIYQVKDGKVSLLVKAEGWNNPKDIDFFGGNLYLLDGKNILVYSNLDNNFSSKRSWLVEEEDLSSFEKIVVDGAIWLAGGRIEKYFRGKKDVFRLVGLDREISSSLDLDTNLESDLLYILDKGNQRVLAVRKNGEYYAQYTYPASFGFEKIKVDEVRKKIFFLEKNKIFQAELKD